jgi:hypothetical protein
LFQPFLQEALVTFIEEGFSESTTWVSIATSVSLFLGPLRGSS